VCVRDCEDWVRLRFRVETPAPLHLGLTRCWGGSCARSPRRGRTPGVMHLGHAPEASDGLLDAEVPTVPVRHPHLAQPLCLEISLQLLDIKPLPVEDP
jgi:hypothetical protein